MSYDDFLDNLIHDRIYLLKTHADSNHVYQLMNKYIPLGVENLKQRFTVNIHPIKNRIEFLGEDPEIHKIYTIIDRYGVKIDSLYPGRLVVDIYELLYKLL